MRVRARMPLGMDGQAAGRVMGGGAPPRVIHDSNSAQDDSGDGDGDGDTVRCAPLINDAATLRNGSHRRSWETPSQLSPSKVF